MSLRRTRKFVLIGVALFGTSGCSSEFQEVIVEAARQQQAKAPVVASIQDPPIELEASQLVSTEVFPSPGRLNPFEMAATSDDNSESTERSGDKRTIQVVGFIELDQPMAILSINGLSQTFGNGETHDGITVTEVQPPRARITQDGVSWYASIFDPR